jgi:phytoene synthase
MIRRGSKSFAAAARLFDGPTRESACMLYAWCRHCDDEIDGQIHGRGMDGLAAGGRPGLERLYRETRRALAGEAVDEPAFRALQRVVRRHEIPDRYPLELLEGFAMDVDGRAYVELEDTLLYCYHVAGVVGVMMAYVMGVRERETLHRAADLGIALQLTNIARDVMEDARCGRVYLPARWLSEQGISAAQVSEPRRRANVAEVVRRLLGEAERYYASAAQGLPSLRFRAAWAVATARGVYRDIGRIALARGAHAWDERVVVGSGRKVLRGLQAGWDAAMAVSLGRLARRAPRVGLWTKPDP